MLSPSARQFRMLLLVSLILPTFGSLPILCQVAPATDRTNSSQARDPNSVALGPGDSIAIAALGEDDLSKRWTISQSGDLYLPYVGRVPAAGKTAAELEKELVERFGRYLRNPMLTVTVAELKSRPVTVSGAVRNPGIYQIDGGVTLYQILALAGGVDQAGSIVAVTRPKNSGSINLPHAKWVNGGSEMMVELSLKDVLHPDHPAGQLALQPHDTVGVEKGHGRLIYVAGEVNTPGAIQLDTADSLSVTQAIAMVGGYKNTAVLDKAILWSCCDDANKRHMALVSVKKILEGKEEDRELKEGDYLMLPPKVQRNIIANLASMSALVSAAASLAIIARY
jgi:polysaccharide export outer membrane protein